MSKHVSEKILLDTHVWIWLLSENQVKIKASFKEWVDSYSKRSSVCLSVISIWEVGMLHAKGRLKFNQKIEDWIAQGLRAPGLTLVPLTPEIAIKSSQLPGTFHGDPADRILVAAAETVGASLVTSDTKILDYVKKHPMIHVVSP